MQRSALIRGSLWRRHVLALATVPLLLAGCANSDFGELNQSLAGDSIHDWVGPYASARPASKFDLTDDERKLRDLAYPLIEPPYARQKWYSVAGEFGVMRPPRAHVFNRTAYATRLLATHDRSASARYAQIEDDARNDVTRMPQFFETAGRVLDLDGKRRKSMTYVSSLPPSERKNAELRMRENASIVTLVRQKLDERLSSYRYALERLAIMTPLPQAADTERVINEMQAAIARYQQPTMPWKREQNLASVR